MQRQSHFTFIVSGRRFFRHASILNVTQVRFRRRFVLIRQLMGNQSLPLARNIVWRAINNLCISSRPYRNITIMGRVRLHTIVLLVKIRIHRFQRHHRFFTSFQLPFSRYHRIIKWRHMLMTNIQLAPAGTGVLCHRRRRVHPQFFHRFCTRAISGLLHHFTTFIT